MTAPVRSALYRGSVEHRRYGPTEHRFRVRLFHLYLDLEELPTLLRRRWLWSVERPNVASFRRRDYSGDPAVPLADAVRLRVSEQLGRPIVGPVRLLTHLRCFGYVFNPVTFYYCFAKDGETLDAVLAEITNTPWKERHAYVVDHRAARSVQSRRHSRFEKAFHVSPFFGLDHTYDWAFQAPGASLEVRMENYHEGEKVFDVRCLGVRKPISGATLAAALLRNPCVTAAGHLAIYWQAVRLWRKKTTFFTHPSSSDGPMGIQP